VGGPSIAAAHEGQKVGGPIASAAYDDMCTISVGCPRWCY